MVFMLSCLFSSLSVHSSSVHSPQLVISELQFYAWGQGPGKPCLCCCRQHSKGHLSQQISISRALLVAPHCFLCVHLYSPCWCLSWPSARTQLFLSVVAQQQTGAVLSGLHCAKAKTADGKCVKKKSCNHAHKSLSIMTEGILFFV